MPITAQQLQQIRTNTGKQAGVFTSALNLVMERRQIPSWYSQAVAEVSRLGQQPDGRYQALPRFGAAPDSSRLNDPRLYAGHRAKRDADFSSRPT